MDVLDMLKWKKRKKKMHVSEDTVLPPDAPTPAESVNMNAPWDEGTRGGSEDGALRDPENRGISHIGKKKLFASPISLVLALAIIVAGIGLWAFTNFKNQLKFTMKKGAVTASSKTPGAVGGIQFSEKKTETSDALARCEGKEGADRSECLAESVIDTPRPADTDAVKEPTHAAISPPVASGDVPSSSSTPATAPTVQGPVKDKAAPPSSGLSAIKEPPQRTKETNTQPAAHPPVPPAQNNSPPQAATPPPADVTAKAPAAPPSPLHVVTPPVKEGILPVPIELALKDTAPFKDRFERKYVERLREQKSKETDAARVQHGPVAKLGGFPGGPGANIKDIMGADGKSLAPNVMPGAILDGMGAPAASTILYGVMISGDRKTAVTSQGEVSVGGKIDGDLVVDITEEGVKFKSGRTMQVSSK